MKKPEIQEESLAKTLNDNDLLKQYILLVNALEELRLALRLPLRFFERGEVAYAAPQSICRFTYQDENTLYSALPKQSSLLGIPQYLEGLFGEKYVYLEVDLHHALLLGPYLLEEGEEVLDLEMRVRRGEFSIEAYENTRRCFMRLPRIKLAAEVAIGKLAQRTVKEFLGHLESARRKFSEEGEKSQLQKALRTKLPDPYYQLQYRKRRGQFAHPPKELEDKVMAEIAAGNEREALETLRRINGLQRASLAKDPLRSMKNSLIGSITIFTRAAIQGGAPTEACFTLSDAYINQIEEASSMMHLEYTEQEAIKGFVYLVQDERAMRTSPIVQKTLSWVHTHLSEELSLGSVAEAVGVHPNYLSTLFKEETGTGLMRYIQERRLEEAAQMIRTSNNSLKEIAHFYRFSSQSHFSQAFKKNFGVAPSRFSKT